MGIRSNAGYHIIEAVRIDTGIEIVLGFCTTQFEAQYVTWQCLGGADYSYGHYFTDFDMARRDLFIRVLELLPEGGE